MDRDMQKQVPAGQGGGCMLARCWWVLRAVRRRSLGSAGRWDGSAGTSWGATAVAGSALSPRGEQLGEHKAMGGEAASGEVVSR